MLSSLKEQPKQFNPESLATIRATLEDPVEFAKVWLNITVWEIQAKILRNVARPKTRTPVKACHSSGKTLLAAVAALWFIARYKEAIVVTTAPTWFQVEKILWAEIHTILANCSYPFPKPLLTELKVGPKRYITGLSTTVTNQDEGVKFQGFHAENILIIMDEAPGVDPKIWGAIEGIAAGGNVRILALGNPTIGSGTFFDAFGKNRDSFDPITISAFDTPNLLGHCIRYRGGDGDEVVLGDPEGRNLLEMTNDELVEEKFPYLTNRRWVRDKFRDWGVDSPAFESRVLGRFPSQSEHSLIWLSWLEEGKKREAQDDGGPVTAGVDVAGEGSAKTSLTIINEATGAILHFEFWEMSDPRGKVVKVLEKYRHRMKSVRVDSTGIGYNFALHLRDLKFKVAFVNAGSSPSDTLDADKKPAYDRFVNLKAELYWQLRELFRLEKFSGLMHDEAIAQLSALRYEVNSKGKIEMETKDAMARRGVKSPDLAESIMLAYAKLNGEFVLGLVDYIKKRQEMELMGKLSIGDPSYDPKKLGKVDVPEISAKCEQCQGRMVKVPGAYRCESCGKMRDLSGYVPKPATPGRKGIY